MTVYIPTLNRLDMLKKTIPYWIKQDIDIRLVIEKREYRDYTSLVREMKWGDDVQVLPTPLADKGIGYARMYCVEHAAKAGLDAIIMSNDDFYIRPSSDAWLLIEEAEKSTTLGVGASRPLLDFYTGGAISRNHGPIICPYSYGLYVWGLNIKNALAVGNYDPVFHTFAEDIEFQLEGVSQGFPWQIHCDVEYVMVTTRYNKGGIESRYKDVESRLAAERKSMDILHERWPDYVKLMKTRDKYKISWQKMLDDCIPDWKKASAMHGGSIDYLRGKR